MANNTYAADGSLNVTVVGGSSSTTTAVDAADGDNTSLIANTKFVQRAIALLKAATNTWAAVQTFTLAPVFTDASGTRTALGLGTAATNNTGTSGASIPVLSAANTFSGNTNFSSSGAAITASTTKASLTTNWISVTGSSTGTTAAAAFAAVQTWNTSGVMQAFLANIVNTASAAGSRLIDLMVSSVSKFSVDVSGNVLAAGSVTATGQLIGKGTATNDDAAAGIIGEYLSSAVAVGSAVSLTTSTAVNLTSLSLTAGDWDVQTTFYYAPNTTTSITRLAGDQSLTTGTLTALNGVIYDNKYAAMVPGSGSPITIVTPVSRFSVASTTSVFGVAFATFTVSTMTVYGVMRARRVR